MRAINCTVPITVRISGRLNDAQLDALGETLARAVGARLAQAQRLIGEGPGRIVRGAAAPTPREPFQASRAAKGTYKVPSYDDGGTPVDVASQDDGGSGWESALADEEATKWLDRSKKKELSAFDRAHALRVYLLINSGPEKELDSLSDFGGFLEHCQQEAYSECDTLEDLEKGGAKPDNILFAFGQGFPVRWSMRLKNELDDHADLNQLLQLAEVAYKATLDAATRLNDDIWDNGLPLSIGHARAIGESSLWSFGLNSDFAREDSTEPLKVFVRVALRWELARARYWLARSEAFRINNLVRDVEAGETIVDQILYESQAASHKGYRFKRDEMQRAAIGDRPAAALAALGLFPGSRFDRLKYVSWQPATLEAFGDAIESVDRRIAGTGKAATVWRACVWAHARGYFSDEGEQMWAALKEDWARILGEMLALFAITVAAQAIPGVNLALDVVLYIKFGADGLEAAIDLASALKKAVTANTVVELEHAAADMARVLIGAVASVVMWIAGRATKRIIEDVAKWRKVKGFVDKHGDTAKTRELLAKTRGDAEEAERLLAKRQKQARDQRELEEAEARARSRAPADREAPKKIPSVDAGGGHHIDVTERGIELCSPPPCPLLRVEFENELKSSPKLRERMEQLEEMRKTDPQLAAQKSVELKGELSYVRGRGSVLQSLGAAATSSQHTRLADLILSAEDAGIQLSEEQLNELAARLKELKGRDEIERELSQLEGSLERATGVKRDAAQHVKTTTPQEPAATDLIRKTPGAPHGGEQLPTIKNGWFKLGSGPLKDKKFYGILPIPGQIAARLRRMHFDGFADFRETFWKLVAEEPQLASEFSYNPRNLAQMRAGRPPLAPGESVASVQEWKKGLSNIVYQIDHKVPLEIGGGLYDLDNLQVVSKRAHDVLGN